MHRRDSIRPGLLPVAIACVLAACQAPSSSRAGPIRRADVQALLDAQQRAWNRGDVAGFMSGYWNSPALTMLGASGIVRGYRAVRDGYEAWPEGSRGRLSFELLELRPVGTGAALVLGRFALQGGRGTSGHFTLLVERTPAGLRITHDHTSVGPGSAPPGAPPEERQR